MGRLVDAATNRLRMGLAMCSSGSWRRYARRPRMPRPQCVRTLIG